MNQVTVLPHVATGLESRGALIHTKLGMFVSGIVLILQLNIPSMFCPSSEGVHTTIPVAHIHDEGVYVIKRPVLVYVLVF